MKLMRMGKWYRFFFTSSERFSQVMRRAASFSVVTMSFGDGMDAYTSLSFSMSLRLKLWWSAKVIGVMLFTTGDKSSTI